MKRTFFVLLIGILVSNCKGRTGNCEMSIHFDDSEYILVKEDRDSAGKKLSEFYVHQIDSNRLLARTFWDNGNLQSSIFYTRRMKDGPFVMYDSNGTVVFRTMYINGKRNGLTLYFKEENLADFSIYYNGQELPVDSVTKKEILK